VTTDEALTSIAQQNKTLISQNEMLISLIGRLVWTPEKLVELVMANKKKDPEAYVSVYNALDGEKTGKQLGEIAGVTQQAISNVLSGWLEDGIVLNVGTDTSPKYRRLMRLPEKRKPKPKQETAQVAAQPVLAETPIVQVTEGNNGE
jgi:hypothetical protein